MSYTLKNIKYSPIEGCKNINISSGFGPRTFYNNITKRVEKGFHNGIDIISGSKVVAPAKGEVIEVCDKISGYDERSPRGNYVILKHDDGVSTAYYHLKKGSIKVKKGEVLNEKDEIGRIGATGHATGSHLHYGVKVGSSWVNPKDYLLGNKRFLKETSTPKQECILYTIAPNDTLSAIAQKYDVPLSVLVTYNDIEDINLIYVGNILRIPLINNSTYEIKKGDTLSKIAIKYKTTWQKLYEKNRDVIGDDPNLLKIGTVIRI